MPAGRPKLFNDEIELSKLIQSYFDENKGNYTITGLALFLGFESRQSLYDYEKNEIFSYTIKRARLTIENFYESKLFTASTGAIFALKNFGWSDKQEIDHTTKGESINPTPIKFTKGSNSGSETI